MKKLVLALCLFSLAACAHTATSDMSEMTGEGLEDRFELRVSLFPWIPNEERFAVWIKERFEKENPDIELVVRPMRLATAGQEIDLAYDYKDTIAALKFDNQDGQHLVEVDTMILGKLVEAKAIQSFNVPRSDYFEFAQKAVTYKNVVYGVPHWTCGYFIMTTHESVAQAKNAIELRDRLAALDTWYPDLGGYVADSWSDVVLYLDAALDTYSSADPMDFVSHTAIDHSVEPYLRAFGDACTNSETSYCNVWSDMAHMFADGKLDALLGYSERLNTVLKANQAFDLETVFIEPAPIGGGKSTFLFTDALVLSAKCEKDVCKNAARRFAEFYTSDEIMAAAMMGIDTKNAPPRYLLPATEGAFSDEKVKSDPVYSQIRPLMNDAQPYPNHGVPEARESKTLKPFVRKLVHGKR